MPARKKKPKVRLTVTISDKTAKSLSKLVDGTQYRSLSHLVECLVIKQMSMEEANGK